MSSFFGGKILSGVGFINSQTFLGYAQLVEQTIGIYNEAKLHWATGVILMHNPVERYSEVESQNVEIKR